MQPYTRMLTYKSDSVDINKVKYSHKIGRRSEKQLSFLLKTGINKLRDSRLMWNFRQLNHDKLRGE